MKFLKLNGKVFAERVLTRIGMTDSKATTTQTDGRLDKFITDEELVDENCHTQAIQSLIHVMICTRTDIFLLLERFLSA